MFRLNILQSSLSFLLMALNAVTSYSVNFSHDENVCVTAASKQFEQCKQWHNRARRLCYGSFMRTGCLQLDPCTNKTQSLCTFKWIVNIPTRLVCTFFVSTEFWNIMRAVSILSILPADWSQMLCSCSAISWRCTFGKCDAEFLHVCKCTKSASVQMMHGWACTDVKVGLWSLVKIWKYCHSC